jgi:anaerobic ribonucleoside-triphosphate reductase
MVMAKCGRKCEVYSRIVGYFRPVADWNKGKKEEFENRKNYQISKLNTKPALREGEK